MKRFGGLLVLLNLGAAAYLIFVFLDLSFFSETADGDTRTLSDRFFPVIFLVLGLYLLSAAWRDLKRGFGMKADESAEKFAGSAYEQWQRVRLDSDDATDSKKDASTQK